jgi:hypothetical protein
MQEKIPRHALWKVISATLLNTQLKMKKLATSYYLFLALISCFTTTSCDYKKTETTTTHGRNN